MSSALIARSCCEQGALNAGEVTLQGTMTSRSWANPFGIHGLIVYAAGVEVGFGEAGLTSLGLSFSVRLGPEILVAFAGEVDLGAISASYLEGV